MKSDRWGLCPAGCFLLTMLTAGAGNRVAAQAAVTAAPPERVIFVRVSPTVAAARDPQSASPSLRKLSERFRAGPAQTVHPSGRDRARSLRRAGRPEAQAAAEERLGRWMRVTLPAETDPLAAVAAMRGQTDVEAAEANVEWKLHDDIDPPVVGLPDGTTDPDYPRQWHLTAAKIPNTWNHLNINGEYPGGRSDVVVAVIDTGVDFTHPELAASAWVNGREIPGNGIDDDGNGFKDDIHGCTVVGSTASHGGDTSDPHGHGSHVAGIIAAQGYNGVGGCGVAFNVRIMAVRAAQYSGTLTTADITEGIIYATQQGADVINMSFGGYQRSQMVEDALKVALNQAVLVAAAGNDGVSSDVAPTYPASLPYVIGVMASEQPPEQKLAWFSNYGSRYDVKAPGSGIYSTLPGGAYAAWSGTSMATPVVSGIAALMRSYFWQREIYSSRFLMGSIVFPGNLNNGAVDAYKAITMPPQPGVSLYQQWIFDDSGIAAGNDGDGRVDAGERVHIAVEAINRSGQASNVVATLRAHAQGAAGDDPYVTIHVPTVAYGSMGPFSLKDNGLVYDAQGAITGVQFPFVVSVSPDCPNDHVIPFELTFEFRDGWNPTNLTTYTRIDRFTAIVQRGRNVPGVIPSGTEFTLTADDYWIIGSPVLVESNATLRIGEGTEVQWGAISSDPYNPGPQQGYIRVRGSLSIEGTCSNPISMFPSYLVSGQGTSISVESGGQCDLRYVNIRNPRIDGIRTLDHGNLTWDALTSTVIVQRASHTIFHQFRGGGVMNIGRADECLFDAGWLAPAGMIRNGCAFLQDNENDKPISVTPPLSFRNPMTCDKTDVPFWSSPLVTNGVTYVMFPMEHVSLRLAETIAGYFGGHVTSVRDQVENNLLKAYVSTAASFRSYGSGYHDYVYIGLSDTAIPGVYTWLDGSPPSFSDWTNGQPVELSGATEHVVQFVDIYNNGSTKLWGWRAVDQSDSTRTGVGGVANWKSFVLRLPGSWSLADLNGPVDDGRLLAHVRANFNRHWNHNAFLSKYWDPAIAHWMRVRGEASLSTGFSTLTDNFWGTGNTNLINYAIADYYDDFTSARIDYLPASAHGFEDAYPFVESVQINGLGAETVPTLGSGETIYTVVFNRDMDPGTVPFVTFGPSAPFTDFEVKPVDTGSNGWQNARTWQGRFHIVPVTGEGYHQMRISGAVAADDAWLTSGYDVGRFRFKVQTMGVASMALQAEGIEGAIRLTWQQDDYALIAGYNVYRSTSLTGTYSRINSTIVPVGQETYLDAAVAPAVPMYYKFTVVLTDFTESDFSNVASASAVDTVPPVIRHTPVTAAPPGIGLRISAIVTDNVAVASAALYYRTAGSGGGYAALAMLNTQSNEWSATIPGLDVVSPGVEYYLSANDGISTVYSGNPATPYQVVVSAQPAILSVTPNSGPPAGGTLVTLGGQQFEPGIRVLFGGTPSTNVTYLNASQLRCLSPPHLPSMVDVTVVNTNGTQATKLNAFQYVSSDVVLGLPTMTGDRGATVEVPLTISNVQGLLAADVTVTFNSAVLRPLSAGAGSLTFGWAVAANLATPGQVRLSMASPTAVSGNGSLARISFEVVGTATSQTPLTVSSALLNDGAIVPVVENGQFTVRGLFGLSGFVRHTNGLAVSAVDLRLTGSGQHVGTTDTNGVFTITNILTGSYTLTPEKTNEVAGITAYDASLVLQAAAGLRTLNTAERAAADVNCNGAVSSMDAVYILQNSAGLLELPFPGAGQTWVFMPESRAYPLINANVTGAQFTAVLLGDVSGNWAPPPPQGVMSVFGTASIQSGQARIGIHCTPIPGVSQVVARILAQSASPEIVSADLQVSCAEGVRLVSAASPMLAAVNTNQAGVVRAALASPQAAGTNVVLLTLVLAGDPPVELALRRTELNEGSMGVAVDLLDFGAFDSDGDGALDIDETEFLGSDPGKVDSDGDGLSDGAEVIAGTKPTESQEFFALGGALASPSPSGLGLRWMSVRGRSYTIEQSDSLTGPWHAVCEMSGTGGELQYHVESSALRSFFRVKVHLVPSSVSQ